MNKKSSEAGRPRTVSQKSSGRTLSLKKKRVKDEIPVKVKNRRPAETPEIAEQELEVMLAMPENPMTDVEPMARTRSNPIVYEAMELLKTYGYRPARLSEPRIPINIIALKKSGSLLILALRSRLPVPSATKLRELFTAKVDYLRGMVNHVEEKIMIWVYSPASGWRHYLVYPGGLWHDNRFPASLG